MRYRVDHDADGNLIYIPVPPGTTGRTVYDVDTGADGELTHTVAKGTPPPEPVPPCQSNN